MKKLLLSAIFSLLYITSASADMGVNVGVSGQAGIFAASGKEELGTRVDGKGTEHGAATYGSVFAEFTMGDRLMVGVDFVPSALSTDTVESVRDAFQSSVTGATTTANAGGENKIQIDFKDMTTAYVGLMVTENMYAKVGAVTVDVITNENLATGSAYGNKSMDGTMFGLGYHNEMDNGVFFRFEGTYMDFDGVSATSTTDTNRKITLSNLDGVTGKISLGKSF
ncbi:hypothetical protein OA104_03265 [Candidatus Pelagibacter sp.]|nr:hypothetical protein [Candidatus Pelagibacter sp.]|tara:strand:+ start:159 stop:830 length:672 start_codon:yes stop_codon:yes gene_type:complete